MIVIPQTVLIRWLTYFLYLVSASQFSFAQSPDRRIGLLELPALRMHVEAGKMVEEFALAVYDAPARGAKSRRVVANSQSGQLVTKEHGYGEYSLVVLERRAVGGQGWARVALNDGNAWIPEPAGATFRAYADLVKGSLAYLTEAWDGRVWDSPGGIAKMIPFRQIKRPEHAADVLEYREVSGQLWFRVNVFSESPCETEQPVSLIAGWVPPYNARGQWTADFYSRGC